MDGHLPEDLTDGHPLEALTDGHPLEPSTTTLQNTTAGTAATLTIGGQGRQLSLTDEKALLEGQLSVTNVEKEELTLIETTEEAGTTIDSTTGGSAEVALIAATATVEAVALTVEAAAAALTGTTTEEVAEAAASTTGEEGTETATEAQKAGNNRKGQNLAYL